MPRESSPFPLPRLSRRLLKLTAAAIIGLAAGAAHATEPPGAKPPTAKPGVKQTEQARKAKLQQSCKKVQADMAKATAEGCKSMRSALARFLECSLDPEADLTDDQIAAKADEAHARVDAAVAAATARLQALHDQTVACLTKNNAPAPMLARFDHATEVCMERLRKTAARVALMVDALEAAACAANGDDAPPPSDPPAPPSDGSGDGDGAGEEPQS